MRVMRSAWAPIGYRKSAVVCQDDVGYFVRYAQNMKPYFITESKRYKRLSTANKKADKWCAGDAE